MGFTRFSTSVANILGLLNKPTETPTQLKTKFDKAGTDIKTAVNGLMDELEDTDAATFIGAGAISEVDESDPNVQAKLESLQTQLSETALGAIPDNSITKAKLVTAFANVIAEKDGTEQTNLNSQKLGGKTQAEVIALAQTYTSTDSEVTHSNLVTASTVTLTTMPTSKLIMFIFTPVSATYNDDPVTIGSPVSYLIDLTNKLILMSSKTGVDPISATNIIEDIAGRVGARWSINSSGQIVITFNTAPTGQSVDTFVLKTRVIEIFGR